MNHEPGVGSERPEQFDEYLIREFSRDDLPLKIRKTELLRGVGLPIPETEYCDRNSVSSLGLILEERFEKIDAPLILRVACNPDRMSMPTVRVNSAEKISKAIKEIRALLAREKSITHIIIQDVTPKEKVRDKVSGRIFFGNESNTNEVIELYKGAKSTSVLNRANPDDPNYFRIERAPGKFRRPITEPGAEAMLQKDEVNRIIRMLSEFDERLRHVETVIAKNNGPHKGVTIEFSYRDGDICFIDIDY